MPQQPRDNDQTRLHHPARQRPGGHAAAKGPPLHPRVPPPRCFWRDEQPPLRPAPLGPPPHGPFPSSPSESWRTRPWRRARGPLGTRARSAASHGRPAGLGRQRARLRVQTPHPGNCPRHRLGSPGVRPGPGAPGTQRPGSAPWRELDGAEHPLGTPAALAPSWRCCQCRGGSEPDPSGQGAAPPWHLPRRAAAISPSQPHSPARQEPSKPPAAGQLLRHQGAEAATLAPRGAGDLSCSTFDVV